MFKHAALIALAFIASADTMNENIASENPDGFISSAKTEVEYGPTCLSIGSSCIYNYSCKSSCCGKSSKICVSFSTTSLNTITSDCSDAPI